MTDTQAVCLTVATCFTQAATVVGYWLKKRKQVSVEKIVRVNVQSGEKT